MATDQIRQMVNFILQEAHEKANEIRVKVNGFLSVLLLLLFGTCCMHWICSVQTELLGAVFIRCRCVDSSVDTAAAPNADL